MSSITDARSTTTTRARPSFVDYLNASTGLLVVLTMIVGWFYVAAKGMPDLSDAHTLAVAYAQHKDALSNAIFLMTIGFFWSLWWMGLLISDIHKAEKQGPLMWIAAGGGLSFTTVFMVGLAMGLGNGLAVGKGHGWDDASIYVMHLASLETGPTTGMCGALFFGAIAAAIFKYGIYPRWMAWLSIVCIIGATTPMVGFWSVSGPLNVGNGIVGVHTIAATYGLFGVVWSVWSLRQLRKRTA